MNIKIFAFGINKIINCINADKMKFEQMSISQESFKILIDEYFLSKFDYYFQDNILIVPATKLEPNRSWNKSLIINEQVIEFKGMYIFFFNFRELENNILYITPLTLPQIELVRNNFYLTKQ
ncbi:hypothetical protein KYI07_01165 [Macrococcus psychrotolerans]|uniref:Uncharacterized protein n=1 Tax=Macrococcus psychrotolerans TaxID=3039389 RepID=A0AAT9P6S6_9STAP|nr:MULTISPECIES: hypothetical protein [Macrococcus]QYA33091.1 hypothetical protein KYI10_01170 [Macrococcus sp. 19Msa1099]QYA37903.1 hypothetical protein KYI07_01165 [Macrococcus caseolyticus]QYA76610.1 hypothetical protein KYI12_01165 [Macrococcus caseolyticus]